MSLHDYTYMCVCVCVCVCPIDCIYRWTMHLHFFPLYKNEAKISQIPALLPCAGDVIWSQSLRSSDWGMELRYQGPAHTPSHTLILSV